NFSTLLTNFPMTFSQKIPLFSLLLHFPLFGQISLNVTLLDSCDSDTILHSSTNVKFSGVWGYEKNGREYAIIGSTEGAHFFEISDDKLKFVDFVQGAFSSTMVIHREIKTFENYAYIVCDEGASNLQIV